MGGQPLIAHGVFVRITNRMPRSAPETFSGSDGGRGNPFSVGKREFHPDEQWTKFAISVITGNISMIEREKSRLEYRQSVWSRKLPLNEKKSMKLQREAIELATKIAQYEETKARMLALAIELKWNGDAPRSHSCLGVGARMNQLEKTAQKRLKSTIRTADKFTGRLEQGKQINTAQKGKLRSLNEAKERMSEQIRLLKEGVPPDKIMF